MGVRRFRLFLPFFAPCCESGCCCCCCCLCVAAVVAVVSSPDAADVASVAKVAAVANVSFLIILAVSGCWWCWVEQEADISAKLFSILTLIKLNLVHLSQRDS